MFKCELGRYNLTKISQLWLRLFKVRAVCYHFDYYDKQLVTWLHRPQKKWDWRTELSLKTLLGVSTRK